MHRLLLVLALGCAGAFGAVARYLLVDWTANRWKGHFPLATFIINVTGAFALGLVLTVVARHTPALKSAPLILGTGFLGGYTTFSTLSFETHSLARAGHTAHATLYATGTLLAGIAAAALGILLGRLH
jgi:CrcB protein